jgi:AcrR family transcriptional regulator
MTLRELKKQRTRKAISDIATELFMERGYHNVTTTEIAQRAEVSIATLFNYFPTKEALVFDDDSEREQDLLASVLNRKAGQTVLQGLLEGGLANFEGLKEQRANYAKFMEFVEATPDLLLYWQRMWLRHEKALAVVIRKESEVTITALEAEAIARTALNFYQMAFARAQPKAALRSLFRLLETGWKG